MRWPAISGGGKVGTRTGIEWTDSTWSPIRVRVKADAAEIARAKGYSSLVAIAEKMAGRVGSHCEHVSPGCEHCYAETNNHRCLPANGTGLPYDRRWRDIDWVICGGESGPEARPFNIDWARSLRDQCRAAGVSFFLKQFGSHVIQDGERHRKR